jgi:hypothetical protein
LMAGTIARETKREGKTKVKRRTTHKNQKKRELAPLVVGSYLTHCPSNVTFMQIVKSNSNGRSRPTISR